MQHEKATNNAAAATDTQKPASERGASERPDSGERRRSEQKREMLDVGCKERDGETETAALASSYPAIVHKSWKEGEGHRQQILLSFSKQCRKLRSSETTTATTTP